MFNTACGGQISDEWFGIFMNQRLVYAITVVVTIIMMISMVVITQIGLNMSRQHVPLADAAQEVMTHTSEFHLWFEELLHGDSTVSADDVWVHLDQAEWFANAMLNGGEDSEGVYMPLEIPPLNKKIDQVLVSLRALRKMAHQRLSQSEISTIGSSMDQQFDASYMQVMRNAQEVEASLRETITDEIEDITLILYSVILFMMLLATGTGLMFYKLEKGKKRAEKQRIENDQRYKTFIQTAMDGYWLTDERGNLLDVNQAYSQMSGYSPEELLTMNVSELEALESDVEAADHVNHIKEMGEDRFETRHRCKDGRIMDVEISAKVVQVDGLPRGVVFIHDLSEQKKSAQELQLFHDLVDQGNDATFIIEADSGCFLEVNAMAAKVLGYTQAELVGMNVMDISEMPPDFTWKKHLQDLKEGASVFEGIHIRKDHSTFPVEISARFITSDSKGFVLASVRDITERKQTEDKLQTLATTDGLTGLFNRIYFNHRLEHELQRAIRYKTPLSLLMLDIDNFKEVNDTYGHQAGDVCLVELGKLLIRLLRTVDICARYGGEEFVIILPQTVQENAMLLAERLRKQVEALIVDYDKQHIQYRVSIGVKTLDLTSETTTEQLLKSVDSALYSAKQGGRNCVKTIDS